MKLIPLFLSLLLVVQGFAQTTIYEKNDTKLVLDGHAEMFFGSDNPFINPDSFHFGEIGTMIRPIIRFNTGSWLAVLEPNLSNIEIDNSNWLLQAAIGYKFTPDLSILAGRIMTSSIYLTPPARFNPLVRCPRVPVGVYGYGLQLNEKMSDRLNIMWDITTDTSNSFQDSNCFDGLETSLRMEYKFNSEWSLAGNFLHDFQNEDSVFGLDTQYKSDLWSIRMVGYARQDEKDDVFGAYMIGTYLLNPWLEVHGGLDLQLENGTSATVGLRVFFTEDKKFDLRVDYIHSNGFGFDDTLAIGLRKRF